MKYKSADYVYDGIDTKQASWFFELIEPKSDTNIESWKKSKENGTYTSDEKEYENWWSVWRIRPLGRTTTQR